MKKHFKPKCLTSETQLAVNNRNQLLPCCYWDTTPFNFNKDLTALRLMNKSNIDNFNSIADILQQKEWINRYIRYLEVERRLSEYTCKNYQKDLNIFISFCKPSFMLLT